MRHGCFFMNLLKIIDILLSKEIPRDLAERLKYLITRHHRQYNNLFNDTLKPKHHLMLHYYDVILNSGPPRNFWCFQFEAKHKEFKSYARSISSRKNICISLAKKFQFKFANELRLLQAKEDYNFEIKDCHLVSSVHLDLILSFCKKNNLNTHTFSYSQMFYKSKIFKKGYFVCQYNDADIECAVIFEIVEIVVISEQKQPYVMCKFVKINKYNPHFAAFEINLNTSNENLQLKMLNINCLAGPPTNAHNTARGVNMIRPKQY